MTAVSRLELDISRGHRFSAAWVTNEFAGADATWTGRARFRLVDDPTVDPALEVPVTVTAAAEPAGAIRFAFVLSAAQTAAIGWRWARYTVELAPPGELTTDPYLAVEGLAHAGPHSP